MRIDAELKKHVARATETARAKEGKQAADAARHKAAQELGLPIQEGRVVYPDAQIEYLDIEGRSGRVNVEIASGTLPARRYRRQSPGRIPDARQRRAGQCSDQQGACQSRARLARRSWRRRRRRTRKRRA